MKECKYCGMPLNDNAQENVCDFCANDDGKEMLAVNVEEEDLAEEF